MKAERKGELYKFIENIRRKHLSPKKGKVKKN